MLHAESASRGRVTLSREGFGVFTAVFNTDKHFNEAARVVKVPKELVYHAIKRWKEESLPDTEVPEESTPFTCLVRGRTESEAQGVRFTGQPVEAISNGLLHSPLPSEPLLTWQDWDEACMVDADGVRIDNVQGTASLAEPRPFLAWGTRNGGLRLCYSRIEPFEAKALAASAALWCRTQFPTCRVELKSTTRFPPGEVYRLTPDTNIGGREVCGRTPDITAYLESRGMELGGRYSHDKCVITATAEKSDTRPVMVNDDGIKCFLCEGRTGNGYRSFATLTGNNTASAFNQCVDNLVHWEHARHVVDAMYSTTANISQAAYLATLRSRHGSDPRVNRVFTAGANLMRFDRRWCTSLGETLRVSGGALRPILTSLPRANRLDGTSGTILPDDEVLCSFEQAIDLSRYGYASLTPIWGFHLSGVHNPPDLTKSIPIVMGTRSSGQYAPLYRPRVSSGWPVLEQVFPGVSREAVFLLLVAKACAERGDGMPPLIFITGPSGAAKTSTVQIAAAICGDQSTSTPWTADVDRLRAAVLSGKEVGTFVAFNEFTKHGRAGGRTGREAMDFILSLTPDSVSHRLYVGPVRMGQLPVCIFTDTAIPPDVKRDAQLARRLTHIHLPSRRDEWRGTLVASGVGEPGNIRRAGVEYACACDAVLSECIDRFLLTPRPFQELARELGYGSLEDSEESRDDESQLVVFLDVLLGSPANTAGWRVIQRGSRTQLAALWEELADKDDWGQSRKCSAVDWQVVGSLREPAELELRLRGSTLLLRLRGRTLLNEQLLCDRCGDKKCSESVGTWFRQIPAGL